MPRRGGKHVVLVKGAEEAMRAFKQEIAKDLGLLTKMGPEMSYKNLSTTEVGNIGGEMVRRVQAAGEYAILQRYKAGEKRLMPEEVLPAPNTLRSVSNNGNIVDESGAIIMDVDADVISHLITQDKIAQATKMQKANSTATTNQSGSTRSTTISNDPASKILQ